MKVRLCTCFDRGLHVHMLCGPAARVTTVCALDITGHGFNRTDDPVTCEYCKIGMGDFDPAEHESKDRDRGNLVAT